jgi:dihydroorotate dehydrogenase (NAD+) catalytic subunit
MVARSSMADLSVNIGKLKLKNPVMVASGTFGIEYGKLADMKKLGAYIAKTVTLEPRLGNPPPRVFETSCGMLNSIGLENKGIDDFIKEKLPGLKKIGVPIIASVAGDSPDEYAVVTRKLSESGVSAIELNLSCPNVKHGLRKGLIAQDAAAVYETVKKCRAVTGFTLIAKLSPNVTDIAQIAFSAEKAGADAVTLVNTFPAIAIDIETARPILGNVTGGLSGPAIKPIALKMVRDAYFKLNIPIIGSGGIMDYKDAIEFILCGASAVQIGTASFIDPDAFLSVLNGLKEYMKRKKIKRLKDLTGGVIK